LTPFTSRCQGLQVEGAGLRIFGETDPNNHEPGFQPIVNVRNSAFIWVSGSSFALPARRHGVCNRIAVEFAAREHRSEMKPLAPENGKIQIIVDRLVCDQAQLIVNTLRRGKLPLEFDIEKLRMTTIGTGSPMHFDADLTNPKPVDTLFPVGHLGHGSQTAARYSGERTYCSTTRLGHHQRLGGMLSSAGRYAGVLDRIVVDGATDTPDFRLAISGRSVPLHTDFHAIVDGTSGDTYLQPVKARILNRLWWRTVPSKERRTRMGTMWNWTSRWIGERSKTC